MSEVNIPIWYPNTGTNPDGNVCATPATGGSVTPVLNGGTIAQGAGYAYACMISDLVDLRSCTDIKIDYNLPTTDAGENISVFLKNGASYSKIIDYTPSTPQDSGTLTGSITAGYDIQDIRVLVRFYATNGRVLYFTNSRKVASYTAPTAGFTVSPDPPKGNVPLSVTFTDTSSSGAPAAEYLWEFGDGDTDTTSTPGTHAYTVGGHYVARQTVTNYGGTDYQEEDIYAWQAITSVTVLGSELVQLGKPYFYTATRNGGYGYTYAYNWILGSVGGSYTAITGLNSEVVGIIFNTDALYQVSCYITPKTDTGSSISAGVGGTIYVNVPDPAMSTRMRDNYKLTVANKWMEIK